MTELLTIASMMLCGIPRYINGRFMLSSSDAVWDAVESLPQDLGQYFTDELGNKPARYGGFLQMIDKKALNILKKHDLFACFRGIQKEYIEHVQVCPPESLYHDLIKTLTPVGWDVVTGNGWLSASCHGHYPINPFTGDEIEQNANKINKYGLFGDFDDCIVCCKTNNDLIPEHSPWFPVAIYLDGDSLSRLRVIAHSPA